MTDFDHRTYNRERYWRLRNGYIAELGGKCVDCGSTDELEFDHIDPADKEFAIGRLLNYSQARVKAEVQKCALRCRDCHTAKSVREKDLGQVEHGQGVSGRKNCRCDLCGPLKRAYQQERRQRLL